MNRPVIAAITPGSDGAEAASLGLTMARLLDAPLILGGVVGGPEPLVGTGLTDWTSEPAIEVWEPGPLQRELDALATDIAGEVSVTTEVAVAPSVSIGIADVAEARDAQLIVLTQHQRGLLGRVVDGDPALGLARHAPCAILVTTPDAQAVSTPTTIGVAWDHSAEAAGALAVAVDLAQRTGAALRIVHVLALQGPLFTPPANPVLGRELMTLRRKEFMEDSRRDVVELDEHLAFEQVAIEGSTNHELARATADVDLMVVGSRRHGPLRRVAMGSVSTHLLHAAQCPVLVVPRGSQVTATAS